MEYRILGDSELSISALSLGTMTFGQQNTESEAHAQLDLAIGRGVNLIDTAVVIPFPREQRQYIAPNPTSVLGLSSNNVAI